MNKAAHIQKAFLIGYPLSHTLSPVIHGHWLEKYKVAGSYTAREVAPGTLQNFIDTLSDDVAGFNITLPYKKEIMAYVDEIDDLGRAVGAINTVIIKNGKKFGTNTDVAGFLNHYYKSGGAPLKHKTVVVLGAGGASRGICYGLLQEGVSGIKLFNRDTHKAESLAQEFGSKISIYDWEDRAKHLQDVDLLVNTTSLGMKKQEGLEIDLKRLEKSAIVYDIVYNPLETDLLKQAKKMGLKTIDGLGMLIGQAAPGFQAWFGMVPEPDDVLLQKLEKALSE